MSAPHTITSQWWDHGHSSGDPEMGHSTNGGRIYGVTKARYEECDHYGCSPVAVIGLDDRGEIERLRDLLGAPTGPLGFGWQWIQRSLRDFANPPIPKPDEPTGLGAVVEDADGALWVRHEKVALAYMHWHRVGAHSAAKWSGIRAVKVLSEGVTP